MEWLESRGWRLVETRCVGDGLFVFSYNVFVFVICL
jgi:hypothetical protein